MHASDSGKFTAIAVAVAMAIGMGGRVEVAQAQAREQAADARRYDIPATRLADALKQLGMQGQLQLLAPPELTRGLQGQAVNGTYTARQALDRVLAGSGLSYEFVNANTVIIQADGRRKAAPASPRSTSEQSRTEPEPTQLATMQVTGSRLARASVEGAVAVNVYTREDIDRSGQGTVSDFLNTLPEVSMGTPEASNVVAGQTTVRLRGLPMGTTLVLVNGRRLEGGGGTAYFGGYFDLNNLPAGVVERIEIVPEGSSAIYGSDALAGVVNIVLKKEFEGVQLNTRYGAASGTDEVSTDLAWGRQWERGALSLIASYFTRSSLKGTEREISSSTEFGTLVERCMPGNVYSVDGGNLPGLDAPFAAVRDGVHAAPSRADFDAGRLNTCRAFSETDLVPSAQRASLLLNGSLQLTPQIELFTELLYARQKQDAGSGYRQLINLIVPASNAFNPFGTDVRVNYMFNSPLAASGYNGFQGDFVRPLIGARGMLADRWDWELAAWTSRSDAKLGEQNTNVAARNAALASSDPATALNLFTTGAPASDALLRSLYYRDDTRHIGKVAVANGFVRGDLFDLPAGPLSVVLGAEHTRSELIWSSPTLATYNFHYTRRASSVFSEMRAPLVSGRANTGGGDVLAINAALRYDRYNDFGSHVTPQYALEWRPMESLLVRAAYAESFKAPNFVYLYTPLSSFDTCCVYDPVTGNAGVGFRWLRAGNPDLDPEVGRSKSLGLVWSPRSIAGLDASVTWWEIHQRDRGVQPTAQAVINNEASLPGKVVRDPVTGAIRSIDMSYINFGAMNVAGFDLALSQGFDTGLGRFVAGLRATRVYEYEAAVTPGLPATDRLSRADTDAWAPKLKGNLSLAWEQGLYSANLTGRYVSKYTDYQDLGPNTRRIGDFWLWDMSGRFAFGERFAADNPYLRGAAIQLGVVNLFDSLPVYSNFYSGVRGYDATQYDIRGRFVYANLSFGF